MAARSDGDPPLLWNAALKDGDWLAVPSRTAARSTPASSTNPGASACPRCRLPNAPSIADQSAAFCCAAQSVASAGPPRPGRVRPIVGAMDSGPAPIDFGMPDAGVVVARGVSRPGTMPD